MTDLNKKHIAPEGATHTDDNFFYRLAKGELIALGVHANTWECYINNKWVRCDSVPVRSLSDVHRIAELEKELLDWKIRHQEASASLGEVCQRAEAAERELENERMITMKRFVETGRAERFAIQQKIEVIGEATKYCISQFPNGAIHSLGEFANQLRQQLNGGE